MRQLVCQRQGTVKASEGLIRIPQQPEGHGGLGSTANPQILANTEYRSTALVWRVAGDTFLQVLAGSRQHAKAEPRHPESIVGDDRERGGVGALRQA